MSPFSCRAAPTIVGPCLPQQPSDGRPLDWLPGGSLALPDSLAADGVRRPRARRSLNSTMRRDSSRDKGQQGPPRRPSDTRRRSAPQQGPTRRPSDLCRRSAPRRLPRGCRAATGGDRAVAGTARRGRSPTAAGPAGVSKPRTLQDPPRTRKATRRVTAADSSP